MTFLKDLIVVHFQEGFFDSSNQNFKLKVKNEIQKLVDKAGRASDIHISFWEDRTIADAKSIITVPSIGDKVSTHDAPAGVLHGYRLKGPEVILVGGWFGACINNAINSVIFAFFENADLVTTGALDIRLPRKAVYKSTEQLSDMLDANIKNGIEAAMNESVDVLAKNSQIRDRGLRIKVLRAGEEPFFEKEVIAPQVKNAGTRFEIAFLLV